MAPEWDERKSAPLMTAKAVLEAGGPQGRRRYEETIDRVCAVVDPLVQQKMPLLAEDEASQRALTSRVRMDLIVSAAALALADVCPRGVETVVLFIYSEGRFPCGWEGDEDGKVVLY
ncbi:Hypothetical protein A7982_01243 [Minicystis rosea]|nr:Hypothetical protein A7982_01243 [Minicystis rosea]